MLGKEQILKRRSKYAGWHFFVFSLCSLIFSIPFCPPVCLSPSLVVSLPSVIRGSIKGSDFKMEHFFQRLCLGLKKKKKDVFALEKRNMRVGGCALK